jgi:hypothetical protein
MDYTCRDPCDESRQQGEGRRIAANGASFDCTKAGAGTDGDR